MLFAMPHATSEPSVPPEHSPYEPDVCSARFFCAFGSHLYTAMFATRPPESISAATKRSPAWCLSGPNEPPDCGPTSPWTNQNPTLTLPALSSFARSEPKNRTSSLLTTAGVAYAHWMSDFGGVTACDFQVHASKSSLSAVPWTSWSSVEPLPSCVKIDELGYSESQSSAPVVSPSSWNDAKFTAPELRGIATSASAASAAIASVATTRRRRPPAVRTRFITRHSPSGLSPPDRPGMHSSVPVGPRIRSGPRFAR